MAALLRKVYTQLSPSLQDIPRMLTDTDHYTQYTLPVSPSPIPMPTTHPAPTPPQPHKPASPAPAPLSYQPRPA